MSDLYSLRQHLVDIGETKWVDSVDEAINLTKAISLKESFVHEIESAFNQALSSGKPFSGLAEWQEAIVYLSNSVQRLRHAVKVLKRE